MHKPVKGLQIDEEAGLQQDNLYFKPVKGL